MKSSHENYIKTVYHLSPSQTYLVSTSAIAESLGISKSSSTELVQELASAGFIDYHRYQGVRLTSKGTQKALQIIRSHRLWEVFLVDKLGFNWDEVHDLAEELEHIRSDYFIDRLDDFLGNPTEDPHGDPIPSKSGKLSKSSKIKLTELKVGEQGILRRVTDDSESFLKYLDKYGIQMGVRMEVCSIEDYDRSIEVQINNQTHHVSEKIAEQLKLEKIK
jgi:DtxR family Mn-dependent transcriptional regulator